MPIPVLSAIVIVAVLPFLDVREAQRLWKVSRPDFFVMVLTFAATALIGVELGVLVAVVVSILLIVVRVSMPRMPEMGRAPGVEPLVGPSFGAATTGSRGAAAGRRMDGESSPWTFHGVGQEMS